MAILRHFSIDFLYQKCYNYMEVQYEKRDFTEGF